MRRRRRESTTPQRDMTEVVRRRRAREELALPVPAQTGAQAGAIADADYTATNTTVDPFLISSGSTPSSSVTKSKTSGQVNVQATTATKIGRAVQQECRDRYRMPSSA